MPHKRTTATFRQLAIWIGMFGASLASGQEVAEQRKEPGTNKPAMSKPIGQSTNEKAPLSKSREFSYKKFVNINYSGDKNNSLLCDLYIPDGDGPYPAVLAIHGGAWRQGSKLQMIRHCWKLARHGFVVVSINYRHAPEHKFPAQVHDCKQAVRWIRSKSTKLKVDPDKIAAFGYSAGGHLAAMLGTTDKKDDLEGQVQEAFSDFSTRVGCVVVGGGPCEFGWIKSQVLAFWLGSTPQENPEIYLRAAPMTYVTADDPPHIFFHGEKDMVVPIESSRKMHDSLLKTGVASQFHAVPDLGHVATFSDTSWLDDAIAFVNDVFEINR